MPTPTPTYTVEDARRLLRALQLDVTPRGTVCAGAVGEPVRDVSRYCCASVGIDDLAARGASADPRCPCARAAGWARALVEVKR